MFDFIYNNWSIISSVGSLFVTIIVILLATKFAKREEVDLIKSDISSLKGELKTIQNRIVELPTRRELHNLNLEISGLRGDIKAIQPQLAGVKNISDLLLENELKGKNK